MTDPDTLLTAIPDEDMAVLSDDQSIINWPFPPTGYQSYDGPLADPDNATAVSMTSEERLSFVPVAGYLIWDTTIQQLFVGDGQTAGGVVIDSGGGSGGDFRRVVFHDKANI